MRCRRSCRPLRSRRRSAESVQPGRRPAALAPVRGQLAVSVATSWPGHRHRHQAAGDDPEPISRGTRARPATSPLALRAEGLAATACRDAERGHRGSCPRPEREPLPRAPLSRPARRRAPRQSVSPLRSARDVQRNNTAGGHNTPRRPPVATPQPGVRRPGGGPRTPRQCSATTPRAATTTHAARRRDTPAPALRPPRWRPRRAPTCSANHRRAATTPHAARRHGTPARREAARWRPPARPDVQRNNAAVRTQPTHAARPSRHPSPA